MEDCRVSRVNLPELNVARTKMIPLDQSRLSGIGPNRNIAEYVAEEKEIEIMNTFYATDIE